MDLLRSTFLPLALLFMLCLPGCGSSRGEFVHPPTGTPPATTANIELHSVLAQSTVPQEVASLTLTGYDSQETLLYGPATKEKASVLLWTQVPVEVTHVHIEYLDSDGQLVATAQAPVSLSPGQTLVLDNLAIIRVSATLERIDITPASQSVALGTSAQFTALGTLSDDTTVDLTDSAVWSAGEPSIAEVTAGLARGLAQGSTPITATFDGVTGHAELTVSAASLVSLKLSPSSPSIAQGTSQTFTVEGFFSDDSLQDLSADASWTSSSPEVASVTQGLAQGLQVGQTTITATFNGFSDQTQLEVTDAELVSIRVETASEADEPNLYVGQTLQLKALATFTDDSEQDVTDQALWSSSEPSLATVSAGGEVTGLATGSPDISATLAGQSGELTIVVQESQFPALALHSGNYTLNTNTGNLTPQVGDSPTIPGWSSDQGQLLLSTFTIGDGATLTLTGSNAFKVNAEVGINIAGVLTFRGLDFIDSPRIHATNGGDIDLFTSGHLTISPNGVINTSGGSGYNGGDWTGTDAGDITLIASRSLTTAGVLEAIGSNGGDGGGQGVGSPGNITLTGIAGRQGGSGGVISLEAGADLNVTGTIIGNGGKGGTGGSVSATGSNSGTITGGAGGPGGTASTISLKAGLGLNVSGTVRADGSIGGDGGYTNATDSNSGIITGGVGGPGGTAGAISLEAGVELNVTGTVSTNGGPGGTGGFTYIGTNAATGIATGGAGGSGGAGGNVSVTPDILPSTAIESNGGNGGDGGSNSITTDNGTAIGGSGGTGGPAGEPNGRDGASGSAGATP